MFTRFLVAIFVLFGGLFSFHSGLFERGDEVLTVWWRHPGALEARSARRLGENVKFLIAREIEAGNAAYVAHLRDKKHRLARRWTPRKTLQRIAQRYNPRLSVGQVEVITEAILDSGKRNGVDPLLLAALIAQESRFRPHCQSPGGAVGLGQLLPATARGLGVDPYDPAQNVEGCARYLAIQMKRWKGANNVQALALASYNAGPGAVQRYRGVPPFRITRNYVAKIGSRADKFRAQARHEKDHWLTANGPVMKDLFGAAL